MASLRAAENAGRPAPAMPRHSTSIPKIVRPPTSISSNLKHDPGAALGVAAGVCGYRSRICAHPLASVKARERLEARRAPAHPAPAPSGGRGCFFKEYTLDEMWDFVATLHLHFAALDRRDPEGKEQVAFIRDTVGGFPGEIVPFLRKLDAKRSATNAEITLTFLKVVHMITENDRACSVEISGQTNPDTGSKAAVRSRPRSPDDARRDRDSEVPKKKGKSRNKSPKSRDGEEGNHGGA